MDRKLKKFMETEFKSKARILDSHTVEVTAPDGELFEIASGIGTYFSDETKAFMLHQIEYIFDLSFSPDKEQMTNRIYREMFLNGVNFIGMSSGNRQGDRIRIGNRIRQMREEKGLEAKTLASLADIDASNLCRIEAGKYSVGLDILSRIAFVLGAQVDLVPIKFE